MNTIKMRVDLNDARQCRAFALFFNHLAAEPVDQLDKATCNPSKDSPCICPPAKTLPVEFLIRGTETQTPDSVVCVLTEPEMKTENSQPVLEEKTEALEPEKPKRVRASRAKVVELPTEAPQDPEGKTETATPVTKAIAEIKEVVEPITAEVNAKAAKAATAPKPEAAITVDRLRETIAPLIQKSANNRVTIKNKLADDFGAESLMLLDAAHYDSFYAFLKELQNEG